MRYTRAVRALDWLLAKPIAHRGLHDARQGRIENCAASFGAALEHDFAIECDIQRTADAEAVVFHDDEVERLLDGEGKVKSFTTAELKRMKFHQGKDRVQTLQELLDQVNGRQTLVIEIKSQFDGDFTLADRAVDLLSSYHGPFCLMSFDPDVVARLAASAEWITRGITADRAVDPWYNFLPVPRRRALQEFSHLPQSRPHFVSFRWQDLPFQPITEFREAGFPVITWTIKTEDEAKAARRWCDQITFEQFIPHGG